MIIRKATSTDYPALAQMMSDYRPDYPRTVDDLIREDATRPDYCKHQYFMATHNNLPIGYSFYTQYADLYHPEQFHVTVVINENYRQQGVGSALYEAMNDAVSEHPVESLHCRINEDDIALTFAKKHDFTESSRRIESVLNLKTANTEQLAERLQGLSNNGITIHPYADLGADPAHLQKTYQIFTAIDADVPMDTPITPLDFDTWRDSFVEHPKFLADGSFIAKHDDDYIGLSFLFCYVDTMPYVGLTGTHADYRQKGISTALKLSGIAYAKAHNYPYMGVTNDAINTGILKINQKLGFTPKNTVINLIQKREG